MKTGDTVTVLTPITTPGGANVIGAQRGEYRGWANGCRIVRVSGGEVHVPRGSPVRITTRGCDISPCGLLE